MFRLLRRSAEIERLDARLQKLKAQFKGARAHWEAERAALKRMSASRHRRVLSPEIVRHLLPLRLATIKARAVRANAAAAEAQFAAVSSAYREAAASAAASPEGLVQTRVQGLTWWVPVASSVAGAARDRLVAKTRFPYRNITQTRELALGPVMLDIGANTGRMSIPRVILGDVVQAYCAEPDPLNYAALVRNVIDNGLRGLVLPDRAAIGSATGTARLRHGKYSGGHHLVADAGANDTIEVPCWRLDDWCERLSIDPDVVTYVKLDTQGWEVQVLRGAPDLLRHRHIAWQLEISPTMLAAAGNSAAELYGICADRFSHFIDLGKRANGPRARPIGELASALVYVADGTQTDIILFNSALGSD